MLVMKCWLYCRWKRWILCRFMVVLIEIMYIWDYTEIAINVLIRGSLPNHGHIKGVEFSLSNMFLAWITNLMVCPDHQAWLCQFCQFPCTFVNLHAVSFDGELATGIAECICITHRSSWWCHFLFLQNNGIYQTLHMLEQYDMRTH